MSAAFKRAVEVLRPFAACDIADALSRLSVARGGFLPGLTMQSPQYQTGNTKIIGPAHIVKFEPNTLKGKVPAVEGHYIDHTPAGTVLFISAPPGIVNAVYGGIMSARATYLGALGTVVSGRVRDLNEQRDMGWPLWARGSGTTAGGEVCFASEINVPVEIQHTEDGMVHKSIVNPGDLIFADVDGVVCVPQELVERVAEIVPQLAEVDAACLEDVKKGRTVAESFAERRGRLRC